MGKPRLRTGRFIASIFAIVLVIFSTDVLKRAVFKHMDLYGSDNAIVIRQEGSIRQPVKKISQPANEITENQDSGFSELDIDASQLVSGELVRVDNHSPYVSLGMTQTVDLVNYRNDYYTLINETDSVILNVEAANALNLMMADYYNSTGRANFLVYGTTDTYTGEGSYCPQSFPESATGNTIDLAVNVGNSVLTYDGLDDEKWIIENCHNYGYILRFPARKSEKTGSEFCPWHLRYVGKIHAAVMKELNYCLEEYLDFLNGYTFDHPLSYNLNGTMYCIYSVKSTGETTSAYVPVSGNYTVSGNNTDSFIITSVKF